MSIDGAKQWRAPPPPPRMLNVQRFAESRAAELESLHSVVVNRLNNDFRSQRNKRRRTTSYDNRNRCRKRVKSGAKIDKQSGDSASVDADAGTKGEGENRNKVLPRRIRRRIELKSNPESRFCTSGDGTKRLRTHVWHAKRFSMTKLWGFHLPIGLHGSGRGSRALLKWYRRGAVLHDASYYSAVMLEGPEDLMLSILGMVLTPSPLAYSEDIFKQILSGDIHQSALLHHAEDDSQTICPLTYMWRPFQQQHNDLGVVNRNDDGDHEEVKSGNDGIDACSSMHRQLWIWMHPSAFSEGCAALETACQKKKDETGVLVDCVSLEGQLARLEVMGSNAFQLLQKILDPVTCSPEDSWQLKKSSVVEQKSNEIRQHVLEKEDCFAHGAVVPLVVADPRSLRHKRTEHGQELDSSTNPSGIQEEQCKHLSALTGGLNRKEELSTLRSETEMGRPFSNVKELWDVNKGILPPLEENVLCIQRHQERLDFFCIKDRSSRTSNASPKDKGSRLCPILLLRTNNQKGLLQGWSIILPLSWIKAFWIPFISVGAHAIGLREKHWIACDVGLPCFPSDFPDCQAYSSLKDTEAAAEDKKMELRPPAVRPFKVPIKSPWNSFYLNAEGSPQTDEAYTSNSIIAQPNSNGEMTDVHIICDNVSSCEVSVARTSKVLNEYLHAISGDHLLLFPYGLDGKRISELMKNESKINQASNMVILATHNKRICYLRVLLHAYREGAFEEGAVVSAPHFSDISLWTSRLDGNQTKLQIPQSLVSSYFNERPSGGWEFQVPEDPAARESYRWPIGFVTTGFVRGSKKPMAVALCEAVRLAKLRQDQWSQLPAKRRKKQIYVLVRNLRSAAYRLALATIVLEGQENDVDYL
ncbi:hypothetical protein Dimus_032498 [Dionaea muscipula]